MEMWKSFKPGDVLLMTKIPEYIWHTFPDVRDGPDGILRVYQRAVAKKSRLVVDEVNEYGPWVSYHFRNKRNEWEYHSFVADDDESYVRIDQVKLPPGNK